MVFEFLIENWAWVAFLIAFAIGIYGVNKLPHTKRTGGIFFMINTQKGIHLMDRIANISPRFWTTVGHLSLILLFGTIGVAYSVYHMKKKSVCIVGSAFFFLLSTRLFMPLGLLIAPLVALIVTILYYLAAKSTTKEGATLTAIVLSFGFFVGFYYILFGFFALPNFEVEGFVRIGFTVATAIFGIPIIFLELLLLNGINIARGVSQQPGLNVGVPTIEGGQPGLKFLGTNIFLPLIPMLISVIVLIVMHEGMHGIQARAAKIKIRSTGILTASILPVGAFVDPDPKNFMEKSQDKRLFVYAAGSFSNIFVVALIATLLTSLVIFFEPWDGVRILSFMEGYPAKTVIPDGASIVSLNSVRVNDLGQFLDQMENKTTGELVTVGTTNGTYTLRLTDRLGNTSPAIFLRNYVATDITGKTLNSLGFAGTFVKVHTADAVRFTEKSGEGVMGVNVTTKYNTPLIEDILNILYWVFLLNLNVGIINLLPLKPLDGGFVYGEFGSWLRALFVGKKHKKLMKYLSHLIVATIFIIFALNLLPYFL